VRKVWSKEVVRGGPYDELYHVSRPTARRHTPCPNFYVSRNLHQKMRFSQGGISISFHQLILLTVTNLRQRLRISGSLKSEVLRMPSDIRPKSRKVSWKGSRTEQATDRTEQDGMSGAGWNCTGREEFKQYRTG
jgi:hypothetical protein